MQQRTDSPLNLIHPPAARSADSVALLWDKPAGAVVEWYEVCSGDDVVATTHVAHHTLRNLPAATAHTLRVRAVLSGGGVLVSDPVTVVTKSAPRVIDVTDHGAAGDGETLDTAAIQAAIDACPAGGSVRIPAGRFVTGAVFLKSEMTLLLDDGAVLLGSPDLQDYPVLTYRWEGREVPCYASLINTRSAPGKRLRDITIAGPGKIDARGNVLRPKQTAAGAGGPGRAICLHGVDGVFLDRFTVRNSPAWCVHLIYCDGVSATNLSIHTKFDEAGNKYNVHNGDGLNPDSSRNVFVFGCHIASQDDCIAIKSGRDAEGRAVGIPSENIRVSHCHFPSGFGVAVGSEMAGGVRNVLVEDCTFENAFSIAAIKAPRGRGGVIENVTYRNCTLVNRDTEHHDCRWFRGAIYVDQFYSHAEFDPHEARPRDEGTPTINNVLFQNLTVDTVGGNAIYLTGLPEQPLQNVRLENVTAVGKHGFVASNVMLLHLDHVSVDAREGAAMRFVNVTC